MRSALYTGAVHHARSSPRAHAFTYALTFFYLDLDELPEVVASIPFFSLDRANLLSFRREDYLAPHHVPLAEAARARVREAFGEAPNGRVALLTHPRAFGHCFNPVSFYYCFEEDGETLHAIVAEITNTPWKERHAYVLRVRDAVHARATFSFTFDKGFHVSPFLPMGLTYTWRFSSPGEHVTVHMDVLDDGERVFQASLAARREPLTMRACARALARLPPMTMKVVLGIHYEALRVFLKGNPVYDHPDLGASRS